MQREEFATYIGQVVAAMRQPWAVRVVDRFTWKPQAELSTPDGATLVISLEHHRTAARLSIAGLYPQDPEREYQLYGPTLDITVAASPADPSCGRRETAAADRTLSGEGSSHKDGPSGTPCEPQDLSAPQRRVNFIAALEAQGRVRPCPISPP